MNFENYLHQVYDFVNPNARSFAHFAEGMATEAAELLDAFKKRHYGVVLDMKNVEEEMSDFSFFEASFYTHHAKFFDPPSLFNYVVVKYEGLLHVPDKVPLTPIEIVRELVVRTGHILQILNEGGEKLEKAPETWMLGALHASALDSSFSFNQLVCALGFDRAKLRDTNLAKLRARYGGGKFIQDKALKRDKAAEMAAIEQAKA